MIVNKVTEHKVEVDCLHAGAALAHAALDVVPDKLQGPYRHLRRLGEREGDLVPQHPLHLVEDAKDSAVLVLGQVGQHVRATVQVLLNTPDLEYEL